MADYYEKIKPTVQRILSNYLKPEYKNLTLREPHLSDRSVPYSPQSPEALLLREAIIKIAESVA